MTGREQLFQQLFEKEYEGLCRCALTYLHDEQTAEDVVQDTFVKIWETKQEFIGDPQMRYYLFTAVRNNCISVLRKAKTAAVVYTNAMPEPDPEPSFSPVQLEQLANDQQRQIAEALNLLPPKCREVFMLIKWHGMSYKDAAATLGLSVKTVENQMGKALKIFKNRPEALASLLLLGIFLIL